MFGRRKKLSTEIDSREMLLRTAERLFAQYGFDAVSTRMLHKESGVNMAMISYYFGSKEGLFQALIKEKIPVVRERLEHLRDSDIPSWEKVSLVIDLYIDRMFDHPDFTKVLCMEMSISQRPEHNEFIVTQIHANMEIILSIFKAGVANNEFKSIDPEMTIASMFGIIFQWINMSAISMKIFQVSKSDDVYGMDYKKRLKSHLKEMMKRHLIG